MIVDEESHEGPTGVAIDYLGMVWAICHDTDSVVRIDPGADHDSAVAVDAFYLPENAAPYNYNGMTGHETLHTSGVGTWNVIHDGQVYGTEWHFVTWNRRSCPGIPSGTTLIVELRAADSAAGLTSQQWVLAPDDENSNGGWIYGVTGRYLEIRVRFVGTCPTAPSFDTPTLCDLIVCPTFLIGDTNCDGAANLFDIDPFVLALTDQAAYEAAWPDCDIRTADADCNGEVNLFDIDPFVACLTADGGCGCMCLEAQ